MREGLTEVEDKNTPEYVIPHPDGKPWATCCGSKSDTGCMCLMRKPRLGPNRLDRYGPFSDTTALLASGGRFFCCHRTTDDGYHRECAGWAAKYTKNRP